MRIYTLWQASDDGDADAPWIIDAVDEYTIDSVGGFPEPYLKKRENNLVREMIIDVPEQAVRQLFSPPHVKAAVIPQASETSHNAAPARGAEKPL